MKTPTVELFTSSIRIIYQYMDQVQDWSSKVYVSDLRDLADYISDKCDDTQDAQGASQV